MGLCGHLYFVNVMAVSSHCFLTVLNGKRKGLFVGQFRRQGKASGPDLTLSSDSGSDFCNRFQCYAMWAEGRGLAVNSLRSCRFVVACANPSTGCKSCISE